MLSGTDSGSFLWCHHWLLNDNNELIMTSPVSPQTGNLSVIPNSKHPVSSNVAYLAVDPHSQQEQQQPITYQSPSLWKHPRASWQPQGFRQEHGQGLHKSGFCTATSARTWGAQGSLKSALSTVLRAICPLPARAEGTLTESSGTTRAATLWHLQCPTPSCSRQAGQRVASRGKGQTTRQQVPGGVRLRLWTWIKMLNKKRWEVTESEQTAELCKKELSWNSRAEIYNKLKLRTR